MVRASGLLCLIAVGGQEEDVPDDVVKVFSEGQTGRTSSSSTRGFSFPMIRGSHTCMVVRKCMFICAAIHLYLPIGIAVYLLSTTYLRTYHSTQYIPR